MQAIDTELEEENKTTDKKVFVWKIHKTLNHRYNNLSDEFIRCLSNHWFTKNDLFRLSLNYFKNKLENENSYYGAPVGFIKHIKRSGKRPKSERYAEGDDIFKLVIAVNNEYYKMYMDVLFSVAKKNRDEHNVHLSTKYFFYDLVDMIEKDFEEIVAFYA
ncbi:hypothetical protein [Flagellimonas flava]|uniref:hypothetical protein n=1 Tax=Flagellimonas flava TaxID=570519 RepID=UPI003D64A60A